MREVLDLYVRLGLATNDGEHYVRVDGAFEAYLKGSSKSLRRMHTAFLEKAFQSIERVPEDKRALMTLSIPIEAGSLDKIKEEAHQFFQNVNRKYDGGIRSKAVYQINLQIYPIAEITD